MELINQALHLFYKGGPVMYLLTACSMLAGTIAIERIFYYRRVASNTMACQHKLQILLEKQQFTEAIQHCEQVRQNIVAEIALAGFMALQRGNNLENSLESAAMLVSAKLRAHLDSLSMIVTLAPLLGLLGTVIGMIQSFSVLNIGSGTPLAITGGVGEALVATATGLVVASLALILHHIFVIYVNRLITSIEQTVALIINNTYSKKTDWRKNHEIA